MHELWRSSRAWIHESLVVVQLARGQLARYHALRGRSARHPRTGSEQDPVSLNVKLGEAHVKRACIATSSTYFASHLGQNSSKLLLLPCCLSCLTSCCCNSYRSCSQMPCNCNMTFLYQFCSAPYEAVNWGTIIFCLCIKDVRLIYAN